MKKDIIISIGYGLLLLGIINAILGIRESPLLESVNIDIMMTSLSIYVFFITISQILYKEAFKGEKELKNNPNIDPIEKYKRESAISRQATFAR